MKNTWILVIIAVVVIAAVVFIRKDSGAPSPSTSASPTSSAHGTTATPKTSTSPKVTPTGVGRSYDQLVKDYANSRIQFDANCQATPASFALKTGSQVLLDNRSNQARAIVVDGKTYNLGAYGYQLITVSGGTLPRTVGVNCGPAVNVSTINLQANISGQ
ncbi:MAG TPA: hypothetical protein VG866_01825 [Candidatus Paceibacterota bacterium]|nr:hypothetical protein [Candidatus Paceibacterota bacterium]